MRLLDGDRRALARGISLVEDDDPAGWALVREIYPRTGNAVVTALDERDLATADEALQLSLSESAETLYTLQ